MNYLGLAFIVLGICNSLFSSQIENKILTVKGAIDATKMGTTLIHEHVLVDFGGADVTGYHRWNREDVLQVVLPHVLEVKSRGMKTLFEMTPAYLGRDPLLLSRLSEKSDLHLITNTGFYGARNNKFIPHFAFEASADELSEIWIDEFENGIEGTDIRPGFIKIAVDRDPQLSTMHAKIVRAAGMTHLATGLTIVSHTGPDEPAFAQLELLKSMGVDPSAFVWTHAQWGTMDGYLRAIEMGAWVSIDNVADVKLSNQRFSNRIDWFVWVLSELKKHDALHRVLISHDAGWYRVQETEEKPYRGYTAIFDRLIPALKKVGFGQEDIDRLLIYNPQEAFKIRKRSFSNHP